MSTSIAQISANRINAQKSTGAITHAGKATVSKNAVTHGLFSKQLILTDENSLEYQLLFEQLQQELSPVGILEQSLVERVAISLWKQKRLIKAETARLNLELQTQKLLSAINSELNLSYSSCAISEQDLTAPYFLFWLTHDCKLELINKFFRTWVLVDIACSLRCFCFAHLNTSTHAFNKRINKRLNLIFDALDNRLAFKNFRFEIQRALNLLVLR